MRFRAVPLAAALLAPLAIATPPTHAADATIAAAANVFLPGDLTVAQGTKIMFVNTDIAPHNVVADATHKNGPIFRSDVVTTGQQATVHGADKLKPSTYTFYCTLHPQMRGSLTVTGKTASTLPVTVTPTGGSVPTPTSIAYRDGALYVASYAAGSVLRLPVLPGGLLQAGTPYVTGFDSPLGLAFAPDGTLYVSDSHTGADGSQRVGRVWAVTPGGATKRVVVDGLPNGRHNTNGLVIHNKRLYVTNGNSTDDGVTGGPAEKPLSGTVLSYALPVTTASKPTVEAKGLRNVYDLAFRPGTKSELWFPENGPDDLKPYGEDLLHKTDVSRTTTDHGFPACVYKAGPTRGQNPNIKSRCNPRSTAPQLALGLHVSANGAAFGTGGPWGSDLYIAEYGSNDPSAAAGHKIVRVPMVNGKAQAPQDLVVGLAPIDVTFGPDGLYVADFNSGLISLVKAVL